MPVFLKVRPIFVTIGSLPCAKVFFISCALLIFVRNLYILNGLTFLPILTYLNIAGHKESNFIKIADTKTIGAIITVIIAAQT